MKISSEVMKEAHKLTKKIKKEYPEVAYSAQLGICIKFLLEGKVENEMVELKGSEKQIAWAKDIRKNCLSALEILDLFKADDKMSNGKGSIKVINMLEELKEEILKEVDATWFIDRRDYIIKDGISYSPNEYTLDFGYVFEKMGYDSRYELIAYKMSSRIKSLQK